MRRRRRIRRASPGWAMPKSAAQAFADAYRLPPAEAAAYMAGRDSLKISYDWRDVWQEEHAQQFTVSRLARLDLMQSVREQITRSVGGDLTRRDFMRNGEEILAKAGWWGEKTVIDPETGDAVTTTFNPPRLKLIFDVNTRTAYSAGQWERVQRTKATHPYIRYVTKGDERVRASHAAWNNLVLPVDHPFWLTHWPPNGWRCRCRVVAISQRDYDRGLSPTGEPLNKTAPEDVTREWVNDRTGEILDVPVGVDPGFAYNAGVAGERARQLAKTVEERLAGVPAELADAARKAGFKPLVSVADFQEAGAVISAGLPDGAADPAGLRSALLAKLRAEVGIDTAVKVATRGVGADIVREASRMLPDAWTRASDNAGRLFVASHSTERSWQYTEPLEFGRVQTDRLPVFGKVTIKPGEGYILTTPELSTALHELTHRIQTVLPDLNGLFLALHRERTAGDPLESLRDLTGENYDPSEVARKDKYVTAYQGKVYPGMGAMEVMTIALEYVLGGDIKRLRAVYTNDRAMFDFVVGLLFHWSPKA